MDSRRAQVTIFRSGNEFPRRRVVMRSAQMTTTSALIVILSTGNSFPGRRMATTGAAIAIHAPGNRLPRSKDTKIEHLSLARSVTRTIGCERISLLGAGNELPTRKDASPCQRHAFRRDAEMVVGAGNECPDRKMSNRSDLICVRFVGTLRASRITQPMEGRHPRAEAVVPPSGYWGDREAGQNSEHSRPVAQWLHTRIGESIRVASGRCVRGALLEGTPPWSSRRRSDCSYWPSRLSTICASTTPTSRFDTARTSPGASEWSSTLDRR